MARQLHIRKWNTPAFDAIRRTPGVQALVDQAAADTADACGKGYDWSAIQGKTRYRAIVFPDTFRAYRDARRNNTMLHVAAARGMKLTLGKGA